MADSNTGKGTNPDDAQITQSNPIHKTLDNAEISVRVDTPPKNLGSLLRLFKSDFFDSWIAISYLYRYRSSGIHDYLCNEFYNTPNDDIEFYLSELW